MTEPNNSLLVYDGLKMASISQLVDRPEAWTWYSPSISENASDTRKFYKAVPWLFRGVELRAGALASLPFDIVDKGNGEVYDTSEDWQNKLGFLPDPESLLWLIEAGLTALPEAYLFRELSGVATTLGLRFIRADTITPVIDEEKGLVAFKRQLGTYSKTLALNEVVYFWRPSPFVEIGPATDTCPASAALAAAGVLFNLDEFAAAFFERGAIKATLLKTATTNPAEKQRMLSWWKRIVQGISNAWSTAVVSTDTETEVIGEGIAELSNTTLTKEKREDIAAGLGIPMTMLWSTEAGGLGGGGVVTQDEKHFYSKTIVPESKMIAGVLNAQIFDPLGYRWAFRPETLDVFQEDEAERAQAFSQYVNTGIRLSIAAQMVGLELPEGVEYDDLDTMRDEDKEKAAARMPDFGQGGNSQQNPQNPQQERGANLEAMRADLRKWRTKAKKAGGAVAFESDFIPAALKASIEGDIAEHGVDEAFAFLKKKNLPAASGAEYSSASSPS